MQNLTPFTIVTSNPATLPNSKFPPHSKQLVGDVKGDTSMQNLGVLFGGTSVTFSPHSVQNFEFGSNGELHLMHATVVAGALICVGA
jgi:hypothetical protein